MNSIHVGKRDMGYVVTSHVTWMLGNRMPVLNLKLQKAFGESQLRKELVRGRQLLCTTRTWLHTPEFPGELKL